MLCNVAKRYAQSGKIMQTAICMSAYECFLMFVTVTVQAGAQRNILCSTGSLYMFANESLSKLNPNLSTFCCIMPAPVDAV